MTKAASAAPRSRSQTIPDRPDRLKTKVHGKDGFSHMDEQEVDLRYVEQIDGHRTDRFFNVCC